MKQNIPCELIRDLLPLYVDGLTSEASNREIKEHLETCGSCRERYERMKRELEGEGIAALAEETREIDYLKKVRRRGLRKMLLTAAGTSPRKLQMQETVWRSVIRRNRKILFTMKKPEEAM